RSRRSRAFTPSALILLRRKLGTIREGLERRGTARAPGQAAGKRHDDASSYGRDRVRNVALGADRRRLLVGDFGEWQGLGKPGRNKVLRGESSPARRSGIRRRRCRAWRDGGSRASLGLRSGRDRPPA